MISTLRNADASKMIDKIFSFSSRSYYIEFITPPFLKNFDGRGGKFALYAEIWKRLQYLLYFNDFNDSLKLKLNINKTEFLSKFHSTSQIDHVF